MPTTQYLVIVLVVALAVLAVTRSDKPRGGWTVAIALAIPLGGICYLYFGRSR